MNILKKLKIGGKHSLALLSPEIVGRLTLDLEWLEQFESPPVRESSLEVSIGAAGGNTTIQEHNDLVHDHPLIQRIHLHDDDGMQDFCQNRKRSKDFGKSRKSGTQRDSKLRKTARKAAQKQAQEAQVEKEVREAYEREAEEQKIATRLALIEARRQAKKEEALRGEREALRAAQKEEEQKDQTPQERRDRKVKEEKQKAEEKAELARKKAKREAHTLKRKLSLEKSEFALEIDDIDENFVMRTTFKSERSEMVNEATMTELNEDTGTKVEMNADKASQRDTTQNEARSADASAIQKESDSPHLVRFDDTQIAELGGNQSPLVKTGKEARPASGNAFRHSKTEFRKPSKEFGKTKRTSSKTVNEPSTPQKSEYVNNMVKNVSLQKRPSSAQIPRSIGGSPRNRVTSPRSPQRKRSDASTQSHSPDRDILGVADRDEQNSPSPLDVSPQVLPPEDIRSTTTSEGTTRSPKDWMLSPRQLNEYETWKGYEPSKGSKDKPDFREVKAKGDTNLTMLQRQLLSEGKQIEIKLERKEKSPGGNLTDDDETSEEDDDSTIDDEDDDLDQGSSADGDVGSSADVGSSSADRGDGSADGAGDIFRELLDVDRKDSSASLERQDVSKEKHHAHLDKNFLNKASRLDMQGSRIDRANSGLVDKSNKPFKSSSGHLYSMNHPLLDDPNLQPWLDTRRMNKSATNNVRSGNVSLAKNTASNFFCNTKGQAQTRSSVDLGVNDLGVRMDLLGQTVRDHSHSPRVVEGDIGENAYKEDQYLQQLGLNLDEDEQHVEQPDYYNEFHALLSSLKLAEMDPENENVENENAENAPVDHDQLSLEEKAEKKETAEVELSKKDGNEELHKQEDGNVTQDKVKDEKPPTKLKNDEREDDSMRANLLPFACEICEYVSERDGEMHPRYISYLSMTAGIAQSLGLDDHAAALLHEAEVLHEVRKTLQELPRDELPSRDEFRSLVEAAREEVLVWDELAIADKEPVGKPISVGKGNENAVSLRNAETVAAPGIYHDVLGAPFKPGIISDSKRNSSDRKPSLDRTLIEVNEGEDAHGVVNENGMTDVVFDPQMDGQLSDPTDWDDYKSWSGNACKQEDLNAQGEFNAVDPLFNGENSPFDFSRNDPILDPINLERNFQILNQDLEKTYKSFDLISQKVTGDSFLVDDFLLEDPSLNDDEVAALKHVCSEIENSLSGQTVKKYLGQSPRDKSPNANHRVPRIFDDSRHGKILTLCEMQYLEYFGAKRAAQVCFNMLWAIVLEADGDQKGAETMSIKVTEGLMKHMKLTNLQPQNRINSRRGSKHREFPPRGAGSRKASKELATLDELAKLTIKGQAFSGDYDAALQSEAATGDRRASKVEQRMSVAQNRRMSMGKGNFPKSIGKNLEHTGNVAGKGHVLKSRKTKLKAEKLKQQIGEEMRHTLRESLRAEMKNAVQNAKRKSSKVKKASEKTSQEIISEMNSLSTATKRKSMKRNSLPQNLTTSTNQNEKTSTTSANYLANKTLPTRGPRRGSRRNSAIMKKRKSGDTSSDDNATNEEEEAELERKLDEAMEREMQRLEEIDGLELLKEFGLDGDSQERNSDDDDALDAILNDVGIVPGVDDFDRISNLLHDGIDVASDLLDSPVNSELAGHNIGYRSRYGSQFGSQYSSQYEGDTPRLISVEGSPSRSRCHSPRRIENTAGTTTGNQGVSPTNNGLEQISDLPIYSSPGQISDVPIYSPSTVISISTPGMSPLGYRDVTSPSTLEQQRGEEQSVFVEEEPLNVPQAEQLPEAKNDAGLTAAAADVVASDFLRSKRNERSGGIVPKERDVDEILDQLEREENEKNELVGKHQVRLRRNSVIKRVNRELDDPLLKDQTFLLANLEKDLKFGSRNEAGSTKTVVPNIEEGPNGGLIRVESDLNEDRISQILKPQENFEPEGEKPLQSPSRIKLLSEFERNNAILSEIHQPVWPVKPSSPAPKAGFNLDISEEAVLNRRQNVLRRARERRKSGDYGGYTEMPEERKSMEEGTTESNGNLIEPLDSNGSNRQAKMSNIQGSVEGTVEGTRASLTRKGSLIVGEIYGNRASEASRTTRDPTFKKIADLLEKSEYLIQVQRHEEAAELLKGVVEGICRTGNKKSEEVLSGEEEKMDSLGEADTASTGPVTGSTSHPLPNTRKAGSHLNPEDKKEINQMMLVLKREYLALGHILNPKNKIPMREDFSPRSPQSRRNLSPQSKKESSDVNTNEIPTLFSVKLLEKYATALERMVLIPNDAHENPRKGNLVEGSHSLSVDLSVNAESKNLFDNTTKSNTPKKSKETQQIEHAECCIDALYALSEKFTNNQNRYDPMPNNRTDIMSNRTISSSIQNSFFHAVLFLRMAKLCLHGEALMAAQYYGLQALERLGEVSRRYTAGIKKGELNFEYGNHHDDWGNEYSPRTSARRKTSSIHRECFRFLDEVVKRYCGRTKGNVVAQSADRFEKMTPSRNPIQFLEILSEDVSMVLAETYLKLNDLEAAQTMYAGVEELPIESDLALEEASREETEMDVESPQREPLVDSARNQINRTEPIDDMTAWLRGEVQDNYQQRQLLRGKQEYDHPVNTTECGENEKEEEDDEEEEPTSFANMGWDEKLERLLR